MARIAIVGPGAVGGAMAAWLGRSGAHEVILCARRPLAGLEVETPSGPIAVRAQVLTDPASAPPVDWILVATKAYDAAGAAAWLAGLGSAGAPVAVLQNGIEHRERFAPYLPPDRIVPVIVECPAERPEPTKIRQRAAGRLIVPDETRGREFAALFQGTEIGVSLTPDFKTAVWRKLCLNAAGVVPALLLRPGVYGDEKIARVAVDVMLECIAVGRAEGAKLDDSLPETVLAHYRRQPPDSLNSLHADRLAGRPTEIDARNGVIVRLGEKHGIATPCNRMAVMLVEATFLK